MTTNRPPTVAEKHQQWLDLVDTDGPFIAVPALKRVWPQGIPPLAGDRRATLAAAKPDFDRAWDAWDRDRRRDSDRAVERFTPARDRWVETVGREIFGWGDLLRTAAEVPAVIETTTVHSPTDRRVSLSPTGAVVRDDTVAALVWVIDPVDSLRSMLDDGWSASAIDRMDAMLRAPGCPTTLGVVTDGRWWAIVSSAADTMTASGIVDSQTWIEEPETRDAFAALLSRRRLVGGDENDRLPQLFAESVLAAEQITEALGVQVRRAVELLISAFGETALSGDEQTLPDDGEVIYDAAVTVLMRVVFLLFAQERGLLPQGDLFEAGYGLAGALDKLDGRARDEGEESMASTSLIWHRLLATSQALYDGATFEDMRLPSYGGSLFAPERFPFLTATTERGTLALTVNDRVMLQVLRAVQIAQPRGQEARRISFRDVDVEQIGYIYEGLLGYTCRYVKEAFVGLIGKDGEEPEIALATLEGFAADSADDGKLASRILAWVKENQPSSKPPTVASLTKSLRSRDEVEDAERALLAVTPDAGLRDRLRPWIGAIRRDLQGLPVVMQPGGLLVTETPSRRNAGAHYTPRSLAEEVVEHALEPLVFNPGPHQEPDRDKWVPIPWEDILDLRVADIACGSGAFLVAAARYLAKKLIEAWHRDGERHGSPQETEIHAIRTVVAKCLYGADINAMAVEMCKLSLWLVSLDRNLPFSFVNDKVLHGNSLLGVMDLDQIERMHIDPAAAPDEGLFAASGAGFAERLDLARVVERVRRRRREIADEVSNTDPYRSAKAKDNTLARNDRELAEARRVADGVIAAGLRQHGKPGKKLNEAYEDLRVAAGKAYPSGDDGDPAMLDSIIESGLTPTVPTDYDRWKPLHWPLAVPDVMQRGGFDAVIGNPPFLGGKKLSGAMGPNVRDWFVNIIANGAKGNADLVAYFLLRARGLLTPSGTLGLIATSTVAQGDTREVGLDQLVEVGLTITRSIQSRPWPAESANLEYAAVWGTRGRVTEEVPRHADDVAVHAISTLLEPQGRVGGKPGRLIENADIAFQGCVVLGMGFILDDEEATQWIDEDPRNSEVLVPYLNGEDLNSRADCSPSRWVIDFGARTEADAQRFPRPWARAMATVRPERQKKSKAVREAPWWLFWRARPALRKAIANLDEVLVIALVSNAVMPMRVNSAQVFSHKLGVFATDSYAVQSVLSSNMHQMWATRNGSSLGTSVNYSPSDGFLTFPRPPGMATLADWGKRIDHERREIMLRRELGLTKLYNLVNDPDITDASDKDVARIREIHVGLDEAVMAAYGWDDVPLEHGFHTYRQMRRWTVSPTARVEILDRLLEENHRRAALQNGELAAADDDESGDES